MSRAEDRALEAYPPKIDGDSRGSYDFNELNRIKYLQGYHQAEKDLELTWEDMKLLDKIFMNEKIMSGLILGKKECEKILKQFKAQK